MIFFCKRSFNFFFFVTIQGGATFIDHIITDKVTSPPDADYIPQQYAERLAMMDSSFFVGDHMRMFPHLRSRLDVIFSSGPVEFKVIFNAVDIDTVVRAVAADVQRYNAMSNDGGRGYNAKVVTHASVQTQGNTPELVTCKWLEAKIDCPTGFTHPVLAMIQQQQPHVIWNGLLVFSGIHLSVLKPKVGSGEEPFPASSSIPAIPDPTDPTKVTQPQSTEQYPCAVVTARCQYGFPEHGPLLGNFNQLYKLDPEIFGVWMRILRRAPNAVLWLLRFPAAGEQNVLQAAENYEQLPLSFSAANDPSMTDSGHEIHQLITKTTNSTGQGFTSEHNEDLRRRVILTNVATKEEHVRRGQLVDIGVDTPLCNGHTTSADLLWTSAPIVSLPLETFASRVCASQLAALGVGAELIASTPKQYEDIAVELATDDSKRFVLRNKLWSQRIKTSLFRVDMYARDLEDVLMRMYMDYIDTEKKTVKIEMPLGNEVKKEVHENYHRTEPMAQELNSKSGDSLQQLQTGSTTSTTANTRSEQAVAAKA